MEGQRARRWLLEGKEEDLEEDGKEDNDSFGDEVDEEEKDERDAEGRRGHCSSARVEEDDDVDGVTGEGRRRQTAVVGPADCPLPAS